MSFYTIICKQIQITYYCGSQNKKKNKKITEIFSKFKPVNFPKSHTELNLFTPLSSNYCITNIAGKWKFKQNPKLQFHVGGKQKWSHV